MATSNYNFKQINVDLPVFPDGADDLNESLQQIDSKIKELDNQNTKKNILTTKGDILFASSANTPARLGIGSKDQVLTADESGVPKWGNLPAAMVLTGDTQPEANEGNRGKLFIHFNGEDSADQVFICLKGADNLYTWEEITFAV